MKRLAWFLGIALALTGCERPAAIPPVDQPAVGAPADLPALAPVSVEEAVTAAQPLPQAVEQAAVIVAEPLAAAQAAVSAVIAPVAAPPPSIAPVAAPPPSIEPWMPIAAALIVRWEISSPAYYEKRLKAPIWPKGASGVTWCVGYDGGHQTRAVIVDDWASHPHVDRLAGTAGVRGAAAGKLIPGLQDVTTPYDDCLVVFETRTLLYYDRLAARAFGPGYLLLNKYVRAALVSLVYNRGASMVGDSRREMKEIKDECINLYNPGPCVAAKLRAMVRLWRGTVNERGLAARREAEALTAEMQ
jgi:hypothetical protein